MKKLFTLFAVASLAFAAQADVLTVCDGESSNANTPIYGLYYDTQNSTDQMIYPADMLAGMQNGKITEVKFFATDAIALQGGEISLAFKNVEETAFVDQIFADAAVVATTTPNTGETELVFTLDEPYEYTGGNLLIETVVTTPGNFKTTYFCGVSTDYYASCYQYDWAVWAGPSFNLVQFLPKAEFTYEAAVEPVNPPVEPTEKTGAPTFSGYTEDGIHAYFVEIIPTEPSVIYYRVIYPDGTESEWAEYEEILSFEGDGKYRVEAYAVADGKLPSEQIAYEFVVAPVTGIEEMMSGKQVAGVRYFNMAGQEMSEANGLTIVVTTYTDGTTSAVKVVK